MTRPGPTARVLARKKAETTRLLKKYVARLLRRRQKRKAK